MSSELPMGDLCVLRDESADTWIVSICRGSQSRQPLGHFTSRQAASEFAFAERDRRRQQEGVELPIHFPDDCPCYNTRPER